MMENATLNYKEPLLDHFLTTKIYDVFASETRKPGKLLLDFVLGYAGSFESMENDLLGKVEFMKN